jgi:hypothetical protein
MTLRQNAKFYNGQTITPDDVAATLNWLVENVKASSSLYQIVSEIATAEVRNQKIIITLSVPDPYAIYSFTHLFSLPSSRLSNDSSPRSFLRGQILVSSGPFNLHEFTQTEGIYLQRNAAYFGQPVQLENVNAFEGERVLPGSSVQISSSPLIVSGQPVQNASFMVCVYDQNDTAMGCDKGEYTGNGAYSASSQIDSRFHSGSYRVESSLYAVLPTGIYVVLDQRTLTLLSLPIVVLLIFVALILAIAAIERRELTRLLRGRGAKRRRVSKKRAVSRRRKRSRSLTRRVRRRT